MTKLEIEAVLSEALDGIADNEDVTVLAIFMNEKSGVRIFTNLEAATVAPTLTELAQSMNEREPRQMH